MEMLYHNSPHTGRVKLDHLGTGGFAALVMQDKIKSKAFSTNQARRWK